MFPKIYEVTIESMDAWDLVKLLGQYGLKFEVSDEYVNHLDPNRRWLRDFTILANKRIMEKIKEKVHIAVR